MTRTRSTRQQGRQTSRLIDGHLTHCPTVAGTYPFRAYGYGTGDQLEQVLAPDYFATARGLLRAGELIYVSTYPRTTRGSGAEPGAARMASGWFNLISSTPRALAHRCAWCRTSAARATARARCTRLHQQKRTPWRRRRRSSAAAAVRRAAAPENQRSSGLPRGCAALKCERLPSCSGKTTGFLGFQSGQSHWNRQRSGHRQRPISEFPAIFRCRREFPNGARRYRMCRFESPCNLRVSRCSCSAF
jgi:hypothetical protein